MRWPIGFRVRRANPPPVPVSPAPGMLPGRPSTIIGFLSDLCNNPKQAVTFVFVIGSIIFIASLCLVGVCLGVAEASRGIRGIQIRYIWTVGISGASLLSFTVALVTRWLKKSAKGAQGDAVPDAPKDGTQ
jgi:hypothetical protein